jgi:soluble lytic murein transglycosylase
MFGTLTLAVAFLLADPRPQLIELQLAGKVREALAHAEQELADRPAEAQRLGLGYLRGHLLDLLGNPGEASEAFAAAMAANPVLSPYIRYRLALEQERMKHPEVAAGLVATSLEGNPPAALVPEAVRLLTRSLAWGGDCRLLRGIRVEALPDRQRRELLLAQADCALRGGMRELGRSLLVTLLEENRDDDSARGAADRLALLVSEAERGRVPMLLGFTFHQHREFDRALRYLQRALGAAGSLSGRQAFEARYAVGRSHFWQGRYAQAAVVFGELARRGGPPEQRARALYQQGRAYEALGNWKSAAASFRLAYLAEPRGVEWAAASLLSAMRLGWRSGDETAALSFFDLLVAQPAWREPTARAALFLASSDLVRGRWNRAGPWLDRVEVAGGDFLIEAAYWRGRLAELRKDWLEAVNHHLAAARTDPYHPMSRAALARLTAPPLARTATSLGRSLANSSRPEDLLDAWLLLGHEDATGRNARRKLHTTLLADRATSPFLQLYQLSVRRWPLWERTLSRPEEILLALGIFPEGTPAVREHFPLSDPGLAYTGSFLLSRAGEIPLSMEMAEMLRIRTPRRIPLTLQPRDLHRLIYPHPYQAIVESQAGLRGIDPDLLAAILREESRFDPAALSPAAARGLAQLTLPTARRLATELDLPRPNPEDLYRPEVAIALGAANLGIIAKNLGNAPHLMAAAYNAGEPQAKMWKSYCFSQEPEEYFAKVGFRETRAYLRRVLTAMAHYQELY